MIAVVTTVAGLRIANELACVQPRSVLRVSPRPKLKTTQIPTLIYAIALTVLRTLCLDVGSNRLANGISAYNSGYFRNCGVGRLISGLRSSEDRIYFQMLPNPNCESGPRI